MAESIEHDEQGVFQRFNLRRGTRNKGKSVWVRRALKLDAAIKVAAQGGLPVRVIVCDGKMRKAGGKETAASKVSKRVLDPVPWAVTEYDINTGACVVRRGAQSVSILGSDTSEKSGLTVKRLVAAFKSVRSRISRSQMAMLRGHYYAAGHTGSLGALAVCGGYESYRAANIQYGKLCGNLAGALAFQSSGDNIFVLATVTERRDDQGHACWRMDQNVCRALEELRWVSANAMPETVELEDDLGDVPETIRNAMVKTRMGQWNYRAGVVALWNACSVTNCAELSLMVASHIVPWKESTNKERLDPYNGLLLTPNLDKLFDGYWISFTDRGRILISKYLERRTIRSLGITGRESLRETPRRTMAYLRRHRSVFEQREKQRSSSGFLIDSGSLPV